MVSTRNARVVHRHARRVFERQLAGAPGALSSVLMKIAGTGEDEQAAAAGPTASAVFLLRALRQRRQRSVRRHAGRGELLRFSLATSAHLGCTCGASAGAARPAASYSYLP